MKQAQILVAICVLITGLNSWAHVDLQKTKILKLPSDRPMILISEEQKNKIIPASISSQASADDVLAEMADNTFSLWWNTTPLRRTSVGRAADTAEKKLNVQTEFEDKNKTKHTFNFKVLAMQALARIEYKGWIKATISYDARAAKTEAEITEKFYDNKDFIISQSITTAESKSQIGVRWSW